MVVILFSSIFFWLLSTQMKFGWILFLWTFFFIWECLRHPLNFQLWDKYIWKPYGSSYVLVHDLLNFIRGILHNVDFHIFLYRSSNLWVAILLRQIRLPSDSFILGSGSLSWFKITIPSSSSFSVDRSDLNIIPTAFPIYKFWLVSWQNTKICI